MPLSSSSRSRASSGSRASSVSSSHFRAVGLCKTIGGRSIVRDVSLTVRRGETVGLLGPNGAGKTTVFSMMIGLTPIDAGTLELDGEDIAHLPIYRRSRLGIGYLPQESSMFRRLDVERNLLLVLEAAGLGAAERRRRLDALIEEFNLERVRRSDPASLSGGERRRVEIARAIAAEPSYLLLDEPFAGVDPLAVREVRQLTARLTESGMGLLITDHNVRETLKLIDRAVLLYDGRALAEGSPQEIVADDRVRELYLGDDFAL